MKRTKSNKEQREALINYLEQLSTVQRAESYKQKYMRQKALLDEIKKELGL